MIEQYLIHLAIIIGIYAVLALSLQLSVGFTGLLNLGHIAFYGIGAYASALLVKSGTPFWVALIAAGLLPALVGYGLSRPLNKLKGDYLALATMGFSFVAYAVMLNWQKLTRGPLGIPGISRPSIIGNNISYLVFVIIITGITYFVIDRVTRSNYGKVLGAIRDDELAAKTMGKNTLAIKSESLAIAAFFAGIAGSLYAHYITYIDPSSFSLLQIMIPLAIIIVGGLGSLKGTMLAAVVLTLLPEPLRFIGFPSSVVGPMRQIIYALILLLILIYRPKGFYGKVRLEG